jgi:hypothetical protein
MKPALSLIIQSGDRKGSGLVGFIDANYRRFGSTCRLAVMLAFRAVLAWP